MCTFAHLTANVTPQVTSSGGLGFSISAGVTKIVDIGFNAGVQESVQKYDFSWLDPIMKGEVGVSGNLWDSVPVLKQ